jgi:hypothetical protein
LELVCLRRGARGENCASGVDGSSHGGGLFGIPDDLLEYAFITASRTWMLSRLARDSQDLVAVQR